MNTCIISNNTLYKLDQKISNVSMAYFDIPNGSEGHLDASQARDALVKIIQEHKKYSPKADILEAILKSLDQMDFLNDSDIGLDRFQVDALLSEESIFQPNDNNSTTIIEDPENQKKIQQSVGSFLYEAYGFATGVMEQAKREVSVNLCNALIVNRNSDLYPKAVPVTDRDVNTNIKIYQEYLFKKIIDFIKENQNLSNDDLQELDQLSLYNQSGEYTGNFELIKSNYRRAISKISGQGSNMYLALQKWQNSSDESDKIALEAYNALVTLNNFNNFLKLKYGNTIEIKNPALQFSNEINYRFSRKGQENKTTWKTSDEEVIEKEINKIVQEIINTTPRYNYSGELIPGKYISFGEFSNVISLLKQVLDSSGKDYNLVENIDSIDNISPETKNLAKQAKYFKNLISMVRDNPQKYLSAIFEILANNEAFGQINATNSAMLSGFKNVHKQVIRSLWEGIFSPGKDTSLRKINLYYPKISYYSYIAQAADSIFPINFSQYYRNQEGVLSARNMTLQEVHRYKTMVQNSINGRNRCDIPGRYENLKNTYKISYDKETLTVKFAINGEVIKVSPKNIDIPQKLKSLSQDSRVLVDEFIKDILGINYNDDYLTLLSFDAGAKPKKHQDLIEFASNVLLYTCIANENIYQQVTTKKSIEEFIESKSLESKVNVHTRNIDLISKKFTNTIEEISQVEASIQGLLTSTLVKNGEGNAQSSCSLSRLLGSYRSQWEILNKKENSSTKNYSIITNPNLIRGIYTLREYHDQSQTVDHTKFNSSEFFTSQLLYDFIGGMIDDKKSRSNITRNGLVSFIPSVNSDKNTIGRIVIDTNQLIALPDGSARRFRDLEPKDWQEIIYSEIGLGYNQTLVNIEQDFANLQSWLEYIGEDIPYIDYKSDFIEFNKKFGENSYQKMLDLVQRYNKDPKNYNRQISLIDQVHLTNNKGRISNNKTLLNYIRRFSDPYLQREFWYNRQLESLKNLIFQGFSLSTLNDSQECEYIKANYKDWIDQSGDLILGKFNGNSIKTEEDLEKYLPMASINNPIIVNPIIAKYNYMDFFFTQEWMNATVGSLIVHPAKGANHDNVIYDAQGNIDLEENLNLINDISYALVISKHAEDITEEAGVYASKLYKKYNLDLISESQENYIHGVLYDGITEDDIKLILNNWIYTDEQLLQEESARYNAQHKRNVQFTATMQEFSRKVLNGIPSKYNVAVTSDIVDSQPTINGLQEEGIKPYDGATFVNPFIVYLENNSLGGAKAGITKKQFVHFYNEATGTGGVIKTCGFGLTNNWMKEPMLFMKMWKMTHFTWKNQDGTEFVQDITKDYQGNQIQFANPVIIKKGGKFYRITSIKYSEGSLNRYNIEGQEIETSNGETSLDRYVEGYGSPTNLNEIFKEWYVIPLGNSMKTIPGLDVTEEGVLINSNFALWTVLGGRDSYQYSENGHRLSISEDSIINTVEFINKVGILKNPNQTPETQDDVYQPLKYSDIHYEATIGAVKEGAANINPNTSYFDESELSYMQVEMLQSGIQLDKEHHATDTEVSLMTQVMSACIHLGYTADQAENLYHGLAKLSEIKTKAISDAFKQYFTNVSSEVLANTFKESIINCVLSQLATQNINENDLLGILAKDLIHKIKSNQKISQSELFSLPVDNPAVYAKFISTLSSYLTNSGIKAKIPGILSVLTPSFGIIKLYGGLKWEQVENNPEGLPALEYLKKLQEKQPELISSIELTDEEIQNKYSEEVNRIHELKEFYLHNFNSNNFIQLFTDLGIEIQDLPSSDLTAYVASKLVPGSLKKSGTKNSKGFYAKLGWDKDNNSLPELFSNTGYTPEKLAQELWEEAPEFIKSIYNVQNIEQELLYLISEAPNINYILNYNYIVQLEQYYNSHLLQYLDSLQEGSHTSIRTHLVKLGRTYTVQHKDTTLEDISIVTVQDYNQFISNMRNGEYMSVKENIMFGRELAAYDATCLGDDGIRHSIWEFDTTRALADLEGIRSARLSEQEIIIKYAHLFDREISNVKQHLRNLQRQDLAMISPNGYKFFTKSPVWINGKQVNFTPDTLITEAYELGLPKRNVEEFLLEQNDDVNTIINNPEFFTNRLSKKLSSRIPDEKFKLELKTSSGNHYYLSDVVPEGFRPAETIPYEENGVLYRTDSNNQIMYPLSSNQDRVYINDDGKEIIVTDNFKFYINNLNYVIPRISSTLSEIALSNFIRNNLLIQKTKVTVNKFGKKKYNQEIVPNRKVKEYLDVLGCIINTNGDIDFKDAYKINQELSYAAGFDKYFKDYVSTHGRKMHTSFLKTLDVIASRTPSQSMQSFMPMKIVIFDNPDVNTAYVNTMQILLQGSDYDVDAVSIACFDVTKDGIVPAHSPYTLYSSYDNLTKSFELPQPSGIMLVHDKQGQDAAFINKLAKRGITVENISEQPYSSEELVQLFIDYVGSGLFVYRKGKYYLNHSEESPKFNQLYQLLNSTIKNLPEDSEDSKDFTNAAQQVKEILKRDTWSLEQTKDIIVNLYEIILDTVNNHNTYLNYLNKNTLETIGKNYNMHNMHTIISDPINLIQAQAPIDEMTGPLKKIGNSSSVQKTNVLHRIPGDFTNKALSIIENQVGKDGIGIAAVALKSFFGLSTYANMVLKSNDPKSLDRIRLDKGSIRFKGKEYKYLANTNLPLVLQENLLNSIMDYVKTNEQSLQKNIFGDQNIQDIYTHPDPIKFLQSIQWKYPDDINALIQVLNDYSALIDIKSQEDMALVLSAMLSLATDNAKELQLAKLNAGTKTIDMYLYGLSIGIPFKDLFDTLTSKTGLILSKVMDGNVFIDDSGLFDFQSVFDYFELGPKNLFQHIKDRQKLLGTKSYIRKQLKSILKIDPKSSPTLKELIALLVESKKTIEEIRNELYTIPKGPNADGASTNHTVDRLCAYVKLSRELNSSDYNSIKFLQNGALEFREMGKLFGLNQGLPSSPTDILMRVRSVEQLINQRLDILNSEAKRKGSNDKLGLDYKINLVDFCYNQEYRQSMIDRYDEIKHTFNILDAISTTPHFFNYLSQLALLHQGLMTTSKKYKYIYNKSLELTSPTSTSKDVEYIYRGLSNYYQEELINSWLYNKQVRFNIPGKSLVNQDVKAFKGSTAIDIVEKEYPIYLGTDDGNASFKYFMENVVIPKLQQDSVLKNNLFIRDLSPISIDKTFSGDSMIVYSLPINMLPYTEEEWAAFNQYKSEFNKLATGSVKLGNQSYPILDLFYYYAQLAHYGKQSQVSLMPIFANMLNQPVLKSFQEYEKDFNIDYYRAVDSEYIIRVKSLYTSYDAKIRARDPQDMKMYTWELATDELVENAPVGNYVKLSNTRTLYQESYYNRPSHSSVYELNEQGQLIKGFIDIFDYRVVPDGILYGETFKTWDQVDKSLRQIKYKEGSTSIDIEYYHTLLNNEFNKC